MQIISGVSFLTSHVADASTNKTRIGWIEAELNNLSGSDAPHVYAHAWTMCRFASLSGTFLQTARFGYATEGALFISAQLSSDAVSALQKVRVLIWL